MCLALLPGFRPQPVTIRLRHSDSPLVPQPFGSQLRPLPVIGLRACPASYIPVAPVIELDCSDFALNLLNFDCGLRLVLSPGLTYKYCKCKKYVMPAVYSISTFNFIVIEDCSGHTGQSKLVL